MDDKTRVRLEVHAPKRHQRIPVLIGLFAVLLVSITAGFFIRSHATALEELEDTALQMRSELHQSDAALLSSLVMGEIMPERRSDLEGSMQRLRALADSLYDEGIAPLELIEQIEAFAAGALATVEGVDTGQSLDELIVIHDTVIAISFLEASSIVDEMVSSIAGRSAWNRQLADISAVLEVIIVMAAAAGGASWLRTLSSVENAVMEKDQFIGSVSHELRTPLMGIVGMSEILAEHPDLDAETRELAEIISHESVDMSYIIDDLLVAAGAEMSELSIVLADLDVCEATRATIGELDVPPECSIEGVSAGVTMIRSDPKRVRQILRNLITNSIRHRGSEIRVDVRAVGGHALIGVFDAGEPLTETEAEEIFERNTRSSGWTVTASVGIGLSVARLLATRLGGDLRYRHDHGWNGFELRLPLADHVAFAGASGPVASA